MMLAEAFAVFIFAFALELLLQEKWTAKMHSLRMEQVTKSYGPCWHEKRKMGTPAMGGAVFIPTAAISLLLIRFLDHGYDFSLMFSAAVYPFLTAAVGFWDDWLKYSRRSSEGFASIEKLILQTAVTLIWSIFILPNEVLLLPGVPVSGFFKVVLVTFFGVGFQNAVNVTDGLDGLAVGCGIISLFGVWAFVGGSPEAVLLTAVPAGLCTAFLWHNAYPASVFMGDAGAHFIAGAVFSLCLFFGYIMLMVPLGFLFGLEIISVAVQIVSIREFKCRVFLMSPIHHHFEMKGWKETQIVPRFWIVHLVGMLASATLLSAVISRL